MGISGQGTTRRFLPPDAVPWARVTLFATSWILDKQPTPTDNLDTIYEPFLTDPSMTLGPPSIVVRQICQLVGDLGRDEICWFIRLACSGWFWGAPCCGASARALVEDEEDMEEWADGKSTAAMTSTLGECLSMFKLCIAVVCVWNEYFVQTCNLYWQCCVAALGMPFAGTRKGLSQQVIRQCKGSQQNTSRIEMFFSIRHRIIIQHSAKLSPIRQSHSWWVVIHIH